MSLVFDARSIELVLKNTAERINLRVFDTNRNPADAFSVSLQIFDQSENLIIDTPMTAGWIKHPAVGQYYFAFGDSITNPANSSAIAQEYLFVWSVTQNNGDNPSRIVTVVKVVSVRTMRWIPKLRLIVDKAAKAVDDNPNDPVFVGYTDYMLVLALENGLGWINAFQPYPVWSSVDQFPEPHWRVLLDAATCDCLCSQEIFAVDTDVNYSDQGNVFTIDHQPKLSAILNSTWTRLASLVPPMKRQYVSSGAIRVEAGPSFRFQQLLDAAPSGSLFRNAFLGGNTF